jgi:hypothetical protein
LTLVEQEPPAEPPPEESDESEQPEAPGGPDAGDELERPAEERKYPSTIGGVFYLLVLAAGGAGIAIVWTGDWRLGIRLLAVGLGAAALLRLVLPKRDAGMLAVRSRLFDVVLLGGFCAALFFLAQTIPNQPG